MDESTALLLASEITVQPRPLRRRWYILFVFSFVTFIQNAIWNTWGPISQSAFQAYPNWNNSTIALFSAWGTITYLIFVAPLCWVMKLLGIRKAMLISNIFLMIGVGIRCTIETGIAFSWCIHLGQIFNGIAGVIINAAPPLLSALWFPPVERTTATAIASQIGLLGSASSFLIGPYFVSDGCKTNCSSNSTNESTSEIRSDISHLLVVELLATTIAIYLMQVYFPAKPKVPPSTSAETTRSNFSESLRILAKRKSVILVTVAFSTSLAVFGSWLSVLDLSLSQIGMSQEEAGLAGFVTMVAGCFGCFVVARISDHFRRKLKIFILACLLFATCCSVLLYLIFIQIIPITHLLPILGLLVMMGISILSLGPLYLELAVECAYPADEGAVGGLLSAGWNLVGSIFLLMFLIPNIGVSWMNACLVASLVVSLPLVYFIKESYGRSVIDDSGACDVNEIYPSINS